MQSRSLALLAGTVVLATLLGWGLWLSGHRNENTAAPPDPIDNTSDAAIQPVDSVRATRGGRRVTSVENDVPIFFYGRLEDQGSRPVADAEIDGAIIFHDGTSTATNHYMTRSDANGLFQLTGGLGESVQVMPRKQGYALASTNTFAFYGDSRPDSERHHPDPSQPVIIRMWRLQGAEPLAAFSGRYSYYPGDAPLLFDFVTQNLVPTNGDLKIKINRPPGVISSSEPSQWSVEVEGVSGGLMEINSAIWATTYWAPVDGYQAKQVLLVSTNQPRPWSTDAAASYFVQTRDGGLYAKLLLRVRINLDPNAPAEIALDGVVNTNGSCNWEGDPGTLKQE